MEKEKFDREMERELFLDPEKFREFDKAWRDFGNAFLDSDLGKLVIWSVEFIDWIINKITK